MSKTVETKTDGSVDELREEYDLNQLKGGVRGKYYQRAIAGTNLVLLDPDIAKAFPSSDSVNNALRLLKDVAISSVAKTGKRRSPNKASAADANRRR